MNEWILFNLWRISTVAHLFGHSSHVGNKQQIILYCEFLLKTWALSSKDWNRLNLLRELSFILNGSLYARRASSKDLTQWWLGDNRVWSIPADEAGTPRVDSSRQISIRSVSSFWPVICSVVWYLETTSSILCIDQDGSCQFSLSWRISDYFSKIFLIFFRFTPVFFLFQIISSVFLDLSLNFLNFSTFFWLPPVFPRFHKGFFEVCLGFSNLSWIS